MAGTDIRAGNRVIIASSRGFLGRVGRSGIGRARRGRTELGESGYRVGAVGYVSGVYFRRKVRVPGKERGGIAR